MSVHQWNNLSWVEIKDKPKDNTLVILPVGTDLFCCEALLESVSQNLTDLELLVLPSLWCSKSNEHSDFAGTIWLSRSVFSGLVTDIASSVAKAGFKRLVILNWHGGNTHLLALLARDLRLQYDLLIFVVDAFRLLGDYHSPRQSDNTFDIHAGFVETSVMLATHPELVKENYCQIKNDRDDGRFAASFDGYKHLSPEGGSVLMGCLMRELSDNGIIGDPRYANLQDGEDILRRMTEKACGALREAAVFQYRSVE